MKSSINKLTVMKKDNTTGYLILLTVLLSFFISACKPRSVEETNSTWKKEINLQGEWKFSIGDDPKWSETGLQDRSWENINVPNSWENEGFHGYDGYAWYRKHFSISSSLKNKGLYLNLGRIDDVDEVYINGHFAGASGAFPPQYETAYFLERSYPIPDSFFNYDGDNVLAVRVYDGELEGGILSGDQGIFSLKNYVYPDLPLEGVWKLNTGDSLEWKEPSYKDNNWNFAVVPALWETQGLKNYDGFAWYRKTFFVTKELASKQLVFCAGKIDDFDQVYLNGQLIGSHGSFDDTHNMDVDQYTYQQFRGYDIPQKLLKPGQMNTVAIRVYDGRLDGGIYQGPVSIITKDKYSKFYRSRK